MSFYVTCVLGLALFVIAPGAAMAEGADMVDGVHSDTSSVTPNADDPGIAAGPVPRPMLRVRHDDAADLSTRGYAWHVVATDVAAAALVGVGLAEDEPSLVWTGAAVFLVGGPIIHLGHRRESRAQTSLLLRAILPGAVGLVGGLLSHTSDNGERNVLEDAAPGLITGAFLATVIDALILARPDDRSMAGGGIRLAASATPSGARLILHGGL